MGATESTAGIRLTESPYVTDETNQTPSSSDRLDQILEQYWWKSQCPVTGELRRLLDDVTDDKKMRLLRTLWRAAGHSEMISTILSSLSPHQRLDVLSERDQFDMTPLHCAACRGKSGRVKMILSHLTPDQQLTLLSMRDAWGCTPAGCASVFGYKETERILRDYEQRATQQTGADSLVNNRIRDGEMESLRESDAGESDAEESDEREFDAGESEAVTRHENLPVTCEDLATGLQSALDRIRELEDRLRVQQNSSAEVAARYENLIVRHDGLTARHEDLAAGCMRALDRISELEDQLQVQQNNSAGHGCSSTTQQTSNGLDQMVYDVIAKRERDNEGLQALSQKVHNNSAGLARVNDRTQENRNTLTAQGLHEADTEQPEDNQSEDEDAEHPHMDGDENET